AASLVRVEYSTERHSTDLVRVRNQAYKPRKRAFLDPPPPPRGDPDRAFASAAVQVDAEYSAPVATHHPMEPYATTVIWEADGKLTIYDKTQGPLNNHQYICNAFRLRKDNVRLLSPYVGGGFGSGLRPHYQLFLAVMAARMLKRSVKVTLT